MTKDADKTETEDRGKRKYTRDEPVSLYPLDLEEALKALLETPPERNEDEKPEGKSESG